MATQIDVNNLNNWGRTKNANHVDYVPQNPEKDKAVIDWSNNNGYDNSVVYPQRTTPAIVPPVVPATVPAPKVVPEVVPETPVVQNDPTSVAQRAATQGKSFVDMYNQAIAPPVYDTPRANALKTNANLSVVGDIAKLIGEGVTTSQGGKVIPRQSQAPQLNAQLQQLNDSYKRDAQGYKVNGLQYMIADVKDQRARAALEAKEKQRAATETQHQSNWQATHDQLQDNSDRTFTKSVEDTKTKNILDNKNLVLHGKSVSIAQQNANKQPISSIDKTQGLVVDNRLVSIPKSEIEGWAGKVAKMALNDPNNTNASEGDKVSTEQATAYPLNVFNRVWDKYLTIQNGHLVPKETAPVQVAKPAPVKSSYVPGGANSLVKGNKPKTIYDSVDPKPNSKTIKNF